MANQVPPSDRRTVLPPSPSPSPAADPRPAPASPAQRSRWDELPPGSLFAGRYRIERLLARGGMSGVYLAWQLPLNRPVALKILVPLMEDAEGEASFQERFRLEARTLASLNHPNIVVVHDYGETDDGQFFLAMEYVDGPRLSDVLKEAGRLPQQRALQIVIQTCQALRYAHLRGVVHRDIKLSNIMLWSDGDRTDQVKVVDFGLVKLTEGDQRLTSAGMVLGSPHFMAPEQARGQNVDHRADIYAVGVMLYCMLAGQPPYTGTSATATILAHLTQPVPSLTATAPEAGVPAALDAVVRRCIAKKAEDRYGDMDQVIHDLAMFLDAPMAGMTLRPDGPSGQTLLTAVAVEPEAAPAPNRVWMYGAVGAVVLLLLVLAGLTAGLVGLIQTMDSPPAAVPAAAPAAPAVVPSVSGPTLAAPNPPPLTTPATPATEDKAPNGAATGSTQRAAPKGGGTRATPAQEPQTGAAAEPTAPAVASPPPAQPAQTTQPASGGKGDDWQKSDLKDPWSN